MDKTAQALSRCIWIMRERNAAANQFQICWLLFFFFFVPCEHIIKWLKISRWHQKIRKESWTHAKSLMMNNNTLVILASLSWALRFWGPQAVAHLAPFLSRLYNSTVLLCAPFLICISNPNNSNETPFFLYLFAHFIIIIKTAFLINSLVLFQKQFNRSH